MDKKAYIYLGLLSQGLSFEEGKWRHYLPITIYQEVYFEHLVYVCKSFFLLSAFAYLAVT